MAGFFSLSRSNVALSTTNDFLTIIPATARTFDLIEVSVGGIGTASAANELQIARSSGGNTPGGAVTAQPLREAQAAAGFTNATTWTTQPTLGPVLLRLPVNANGGIYRWVRPPGQVITFIDSNTNEMLSARSAVGTSSVSVHIIVEEF
jgi:hypothetical protein